MFICELYFWAPCLSRTQPASSFTSLSSSDSVAKEGAWLTCRNFRLP